MCEEEKGGNAVKVGGRVGGRGNLKRQYFLAVLHGYIWAFFFFFLFFKAPRIIYLELLTLSDATTEERTTNKVA